MSRLSLSGGQGLTKQTHPARSRQAGRYGVRVGRGPGHSPPGMPLNPVEEGAQPGCRDQEGVLGGGGRKQEARKQVHGLWVVGMPGERASGRFSIPRSGRSFRSGRLRARGVSHAGRSGLLPDSFLWLSERARVGMVTQCGAGLLLPFREDRNRSMVAKHA